MMERVKCKIDSAMCKTDSAKCKIDSVKHSGRYYIYLYFSQK